MSRPRPLEVKAVVELLEQDWETPEVLAEELIRTIDRVRTDRTSYVAVMQFGSQKPVWYAGIGPYPGEKTARNAVVKHPGCDVATAVVVIPLLSPEGFEQKLKEVG